MKCTSFILLPFVLWRPVLYTVIFVSVRRHWSFPGQLVSSLPQKVETFIPRPISSDNERLEFPRTKKCFGHEVLPTCRCYLWQSWSIVFTCSRYAILAEESSLYDKVWLPKPRGLETRSKVVGYTRKMYLIYHGITLWNAESKYTQHK